MKRKKNLTLFRKIRNKILRVPESYSQGTFGNEANTPCGTRACIAGHALLESGFCTPAELIDANTYFWASDFDIETEARRLLGLTPAEASRLFDGNAFGWPKQFERRFREAQSPEMKARAAADYLNHIIRTGKVTA